MGDSDDEYDRRRRDKFRRERSDYDRSREREDRRRDDWNDRSGPDTVSWPCDVHAALCLCSWLVFSHSTLTREWDRGRERRSRGEYRDYDRGRRERFTPPRHDMSPQQKRMRRDWWDEHQWPRSVLAAAAAAARCRWKPLLCRCQGRSRWRSLPRRLRLGLQRRRRPQLWPPAALGPPWPASHAASSWHPHTSEVRGGAISLDPHLAAPFSPFRHSKISFPAGSATSMTSTLVHLRP